MSVGRFCLILNRRGFAAALGVDWRFKPVSHAAMSMNREFAEALVADLEQLLRLHDRELDQPLIDSLREIQFPEGLALLSKGEAGEGARQLMAATLAQTMDLDLLAADYAAIYLTAAYGASPYESVWITEEHLTSQQPMFEWREIYAADGFKVDDWRQRYDDHLVLQIQWLAHRIENPATDWQETARLLDEHLLHWLPDWAERVEARADTAFYVALAALTANWLEDFRAMLAEMFNLPRPDRETIAARIQAKFKTEAETIQPIKFYPGAEGPSW